MQASIFYLHFFFFAPPLNFIFFFFFPICSRRFFFFNFLVGLTTVQNRENKKKGGKRKKWKFTHFPQLFQHFFFVFWCKNRVKKKQNGEKKKSEFSRIFVSKALSQQKCVNFNFFLSPFGFFFAPPLGVVQKVEYTGLLSSCVTFKLSYSWCYH